MSYCIPLVSSGLENPVRHIFTHPSLPFVEAVKRAKTVIKVETERWEAEEDNKPLQDQSPLEDYLVAELQLAGFEMLLFESIDFGD